MGVLRAEAPAKLNLSLRVRPRDASGLHRVRGLTQSIGWHDILTMAESDADHLRVHGADLPSGEDNLVWKAVRALRGMGADHSPVSVRLWKRIPVAAGLAGGSADAAAALLLYGRLVGWGRSEAAEAAVSVGSDVRFCLYGGRRWIDGYGERVGARLGTGRGFAVAVAVPPFRLATARVYEIWDRLDGPRNPRVDGRDLPPDIRAHGPLSNDLYAAAARAQPLVEDWRSELENRWDRPILMSGSGPSLFGFFPDEAEASEARDIVPSEARAAWAAQAIGHGARLVDDH